MKAACVTMGTSLRLPSHTFSLDRTEKLYLCQLHSDCKNTLQACCLTLQPSPCYDTAEKLLCLAALWAPATGH